MARVYHQPFKVRLIYKNFKEFFPYSSVSPSAETSRHRFRDPTDITEWLIRDWRLMEGTFHPVHRKSKGRYLSLESESAQQIAAELEKPHKMICINDGFSSYEQFEEDKKVLRAAFARKFPHKSSFEK